MSPASSTMPDFTGCTVDERYQIIRLLGAGTYGVVYQAVDNHPSAGTKSLYRAIKIISKVNRRESELDAVRREIALQSIVAGHRNIVGLRDAFEDDDYFYIILDYCQGGDLFEHICEKRTYAYNDNVLRKAFLSLVDAVEACHDAKVFHRDLKPENVLTNEDGSEVFLADFGLATNQTIVNEFGVGTKIYMSPECVGREFGYKPFCARFSDVWALGVILINMISGRHPWQKATMEDECFARFVQDPDFLLDVLPISDGAHDILQRLLALNPLQRITLPELRRAILALDTFFLSEAELAAAGEFAQIAAAQLLEDQAGEERDVGATRCPASPAAQSTHHAAAAIDISVFPPQKGTRDCSAGSAVDSAASSRASSTDSVLATPGATTPLLVVCGGKEGGESVWEKRRAEAEYLISRLSSFRF
ncbi:kinase-like domain-containing protein [Lenzites betulinus]|nr:kinase-like domain-containing protein [Lenzites betulinus]